MSYFDDILDSMEEMDSDKVSDLINHNLSESLYNKQGNHEQFTKAFEQMKVLGNTKLKFIKKSARVINYPAVYPLFHKQKILNFKFVGNLTKNHLTLFFILHNEKVVNIYDVIDVKKKVGSVPLDNFQILVFPINDGCL